MTLANAALVLVLTSTVLLGVLTLWKRRRRRTVRVIRAFRELDRAIGLSVEDGTRLHFSLGRGSLLEERGAPALAALSMLRRTAERTAPGDRPPVVTAGDAALAILSQDTLQAAHRAAGTVELYEASDGRLAGLTAFSYAAGALPIARDESASVHVLIGSFGPEVALLTEAAEREGAFTLAASDSLPAQAVLYACAQQPLIGEELYAAGAYTGAGRAHQASLQLQDFLRWVLILALAAGAVATLLGVL